MRLIDQTRESLLEYTSTQISRFFPDGRDDPVRKEIGANLSEALGRVERCINATRMWQPGEFYYLQTAQYCIYLYFLANTIWRNGGDVGVCSRLFYLNKALNGIDCFYEVQMPDIFCIGHSSGIVLAKASYSDYFVLHQNCTVGKNHGVAPLLEEGVVMYPNSTIIGRCNIGKGTIVSCGVNVINRATPGDCVAFAGNDGDLVFKSSKQKVLEDIFRLP
jgi:serine O-acetyltransferase